MELILNAQITKNILEILMHKISNIVKINNAEIHWISCVIWNCFPKCSHIAICMYVRTYMYTI